MTAHTRDYSLGIDLKTDYLMDISLLSGEACIAECWLDRWALRRASQDRVREEMRNSLPTRPVSHGARVPLPTEDPFQESLPFVVEAP